VGVTRESRRTVFRRIACQPTIEWPVYTSSPLYDRASLAGLESDIRGVAGAWFNHVHHESVEKFVCSLPLAYFQFNVHDCYEGPTRYEIDTLFRLFVLKELHGWEHETALYEYLESHPELCERLGLETVPEQSTLWRSWHTRFTNTLRKTVKKAARTILIKAQNADVTVPRESEQILPARGDDVDESVPDDRAILDNADRVTEHVSRVVFPAFSLTVARAVRSTRTPTGACRHISTSRAAGCKRRCS